MSINQTAPRAREVPVIRPELETRYRRPQDLPLKTRVKHALRWPLRRISWPFQALVMRMVWLYWGHLSPEKASANGRRLLQWLGPRLPRHWRLRSSLSAAFTELSDDEIDEVARAVWANFGATLAEYPHLRRIAFSEPGKYMEIDEADAVRAWRESGRPVVFVTAHLANWEISAAAAAARRMPLTVVYAPQANPFIEKMVQKYRERLDCGFVTKRLAARQLIGELRQGRSIAVLSDLRVDDGEILSFFDRPTSTTLVPARLALKYGCPLVPVQVKRLGDARFRVIAHPPIRPDDPDASAIEQARQMMQRFNLLLEEWIREQPGCWVCLKRRWKSVSPHRRRQK